MVNIPVTPEVLRWAREERGLSVDAAARLLEFDQPFLEGLESGGDLPTLGQLQRMATRYQIALASLLMPAPLPRSTRHTLHDFRAFGGQKATDLTQETLLAIEEANEFVDIISDIREADEDASFPLDVPMYRVADNPDAVAQKERRRIGLTGTERHQFMTDRDAFLAWREIVEEQGVLVYQLKLGADDSRGFAIWDERKTPAIVVDASESSYAPKSFTIWHEYAHILLRQGGISNQNRNDRTERFCNQFAAAFLMPATDFVVEAGRIEDADVTSADVEISRLAKRFRVSKQSVALRYEDLSLADVGFFQKMVAIWSSRGGTSAAGRANHQQRLVNRFGSRHIETVLTALDRGLINKMDVFEYTNIKPAYFRVVRQEIEQRRAKSGRGR